MTRLTELEKHYTQVKTVQGLTSVFEAIASIHLTQIRDKVISSTLFFNELWHIYSQLRADKKENIGRHPTVSEGSFALVAVTSEGGLIGDIDEKIITTLLRNKRSEESDIFVIGSHGAGLLANQGITPKQSFPLPSTDENVGVSQLAQILSKYKTATLYYQQYVSLSHQEVAEIELFSAVAVLGEEQESKNPEIISSRDYLFEPSQRIVLDYMESVMLQIALGQVVLESKLAQYASRFTAMNAAKNKAKDIGKEIGQVLHRTKRNAKDERTKEMVSVMKLLRQGGV